MKNEDQKNNQHGDWTSGGFLRVPHHQFLNPLTLGKGKICEVLALGGFPDLSKARKCGLGGFPHEQLS